MAKADPFRFGRIHSSCALEEKVWKEKNGEARKMWREVKKEVEACAQLIDDKGVIYFNMGLIFQILI